MVLSPGGRVVPKTKMLSLFLSLNSISNLSESETRTKRVARTRFGCCSVAGVAVAVGYIHEQAHTGKENAR